MRKSRYTEQSFRILSYMMAALIAFLQPCSVLASENNSAAVTGGLSAAGTELPEENAGLPTGAETPEENTGLSGTEGEKPESGGTDSIKYITAFEALAEEETYYPCMYKPALEELLGVFPEQLLVWLEDGETPVELAVTWQCEEDYTGTSQPLYLFYPVWDETQYALAEAAADNIEIPVIAVEVPQEGGSIRNPEEAKSSLQNIIQEKTVLASVYLCDTYEIKDGPSYDGGTVLNVSSGQSVQITGVESDEYGAIWYQVLLYRNGTAYTGYAERNFLATSDEDFVKWEETYLDLSAVPMTMALSEGCPDIDQFPASYQNALYALKEKHPDWTFVRMDTGLDWNTVITNEMGEKSLISDKRSGSWQNGSHSQKGWSYASEGILKYYMDPRNFLAEPYVFQFEQLVYNSSYHTSDAVQEMLRDSFMASAIPDDGRTYAQAFTTIGQELGVSPFHLASRVLQEQGPKGTSALISGARPGYEGYYNFFNVGASGKTIEEVIVNGLKRAVKEGWNSRYASLRGGAYIIGNQYILCEQDTLYLEKFNVAGGKYANYTHQYMQNIEAPYSESSKIYRAYTKAGVLERKFVFKIPVYENMPASACAQPEKTDALTLDKTTVSSLAVDKSVMLIPYVNGSKVDHVNDMTFTSSNTAVAVVDAQGKVTAVSPGEATISCARSGANRAECKVTVVKGRPVVATPVLSPVTYWEGIKLADIVLPDGWTWVDGSVSVAVGTPAYAAVYTPTDTTKYNTLTKDISFTVTKAIPVCQVPTGLEVKSGAKLGSIVLPDGFAWESDMETALTSVGEYTFYVSYNPDENNYYTVNHIPIIVQVKENVTEQPSGGNTSGNGSGSISGGSGSTSESGGADSGSGNASGGGGTDSGSGSTSGGGNASGNAGSGSGNTSGGGTSGSGGSSGGGNASGNIGSGSGNTSGGSTSENGGSSGGGNASGNIGSGSGNTFGGSTSGSGGSSGGGNASGNIGSGSGNTSSGSASGSGDTSGSSSESTFGGSTQPSCGTTTIPSGGANGTGSQSGSTSDGKPQSGNTPSDNTPSENGSENTSADGQNENQASGNGSDSGVQQTGTTAAPSGNTNNTGTGESTQQNAPGTANGGGGTQTSVSEGSGDDRKEETGSSSADDAEGGAGTEEMNYYRPAVTIQMEDTTILTPEKIQMAKEQNFDLLLDMGGAVSWSIDVDSIGENESAEVDMGVTLGTENIPKELISAILDGRKYLEVTLAHQGPFGFEPVLHIAIGKEYSGQYANLFYYDPEKESLEFICDVVIGPDGVASLRFDHASCYLVIVSGQSMAGVSIEDDSVNPVTRWIIIGVFVCMILVVIGYGIYFFLKRKWEEEDDDADDTEEDDADGDLEFEELDEDDGPTYEEPGDRERDIEYEELDDEEDDIEYEELDDEESDIGYETFDVDDTGYGEYDDEDEEDAGYEEYDGEDDIVYEEDEDEEFDEEDDIGYEINVGPKHSMKTEDDEYFDDEEDDWIEDEDWSEPESDKKSLANLSIIDIRREKEWSEEEKSAENDWIEDDEWADTVKGNGQNRSTRYKT